MSIKTIFSSIFGVGKTVAADIEKPIAVGAKAGVVKIEGMASSVLHGGESAEQAVERLGDYLAGRFEIGETDVVHLAEVLKAKLASSVPVEDLEGFVKRLRSITDKGFSIVGSDADRVIDFLEDHLHLTGIVADLEKAKNLAEHEADALKAEWEKEEQAAREYYSKLAVGDAAIEFMHTVLGEAGVVIQDATHLDAIKAAVERRLDKGSKTAPATAVTANGAASSTTTAPAIALAPAVATAAEDEATK